MQGVHLPLASKLTQIMCTALVVFQAVNGYQSDEAAEVTSPLSVYRNPSLIDPAINSTDEASVMWTKVEIISDGRGISEPPLRRCRFASPVLSPSVRSSPEVDTTPSTQQPSTGSGKEYTSSESSIPALQGPTTDDIPVRPANGINILRSGLTGGPRSDANFVFRLIPQGRWISTFYYASLLNFLLRDVQDFLHQSVPANANREAQVQALLWLIAHCFYETAIHDALRFSED